MNGARTLILAAGRGRRAGGAKAWRPYKGKSLIEAHLDFFRDLCGAAAISVAIQPEWLSRCMELSPQTLWVSADPDAEPLDSLQRLIAASPAARSFVLHVDMPVFDRSVYETLWMTTCDAVVPVFNGRRGHPVLLSPPALARIAALDGKKDRLDAWLRSQESFAASVSTDVIFKNMNEASA